MIILVSWSLWERNNRNVLDSNVHKLIKRQWEWCKVCCGF